MFNTAQMMIEEQNGNFAKPVLYEVPTYLALNFNWNTKQKNKKKKSDGRN